MKTLYLHIGFGKTGTTALQHFFGDNRNDLKNFGILYPKEGCIASAHHLFSPFKPHFLDRWEFKNVVDWAPNFTRGSHKRILISSELITQTDPKNVDEFCKVLKKYYYVKVIAYIRRQDEMLMSGYNQGIKAGYIRTNYENYINNRINSLDYEEWLIPWEKNLGKDNIFLRVFERSSLYKGDVIKDFLVNILFINEGDAIFEKVPSYPTKIDIKDKSNFSEIRKINPSLNLESVYFKENINKIFISKELSRILKDLLSVYSYNNPSKTKLFPYHIRKQIFENYTEHNKKIGKKYLNQDNGLFNEYPQEEDWKDYRLIGRQKLTKIVEFIKNYDSKLIDDLLFYIAEYGKNSNTIKEIEEYIYPSVKKIK